jgi:4-hydroxy-tetrahydrodipicolinate reductase
LLFCPFADLKKGELMQLKVCVAGATGWVGRPLCVAVSETDDLRLVGAVSRTYQGQNLKDVSGDPRLDVMVSGSVAEALATPTDVLVDFTRADVVKAHVMTAICQGVHVVIGTSGLTEEDFLEIERAALDQHVGVIAAGNFALTAVLLERFACEAARYLSQWEIMDYASHAKVDAPSGTTRELAFRLSQVGQPQVSHPIEETIGPKESRGATLNGSQVHAIRLPGYVLSVEVIFGAADERLVIRHEAGNSATPYLPGTLLAIRKVRDQVGLVRGLDNVLE